MLPPRRILVAVDFSRTSRLALDVATRLARQCSSELHVIHVPDPAIAAAATEARIDLHAEARDELQGFASAVAGGDPTAPHIHVVDGDAAQVIVDIAQRERIDLTVIGTRGHTEAVWPALGTTAEQVIHHSLTPVLLIPPDWRAGDVLGSDLSSGGPIIVGMDMTCPSITAASDACRLAAALKTRVALIHAVPPPQVADRWRQLAADAAERKYAGSFADYARVAQAIQAASTVPTALSIARGPVVEVLLDACKAERYALVVLARGTRPHDYGAPGSVVTRVLTMGHVPVLMHVAV
jgi:nucleotide-binding universal stress UspA family protein